MTNKHRFGLEVGRIARPNLTFISAALFLGSIVTPVEANSEVIQLLEDMQSLNLHQAHMDFADYLSNINERELNQQTSLLNSFVDQLNIIKTNDQVVSRCDVIALDDAEYALSIAEERLSLLRSYIEQPVSYGGSFANFNDNNRWYQHWLSSWLQNDVTIDELKRIAEHELEQVQGKRVLLRDAELPEVNVAIPQENSDAIISQFRQREEVINSHLANIIETDFIAAPVTIVESDLPKSFPAPGIYNPESQEFIYHLSSDEFPVKHMDWLFLHEAVPGHHYFSEFANNEAECIGYRSPQGSTLFTEGWAAYVETLGHELGVFKDKSSIEYALDWRALRAVRVLLDIGIHTQGWTDEKAAEVWMHYIPNQQPIMAREIARIRRWPVQVITYVYGKQRIEQLIADALSQDVDLTRPEVHLAILELSNFSLRSLNHIQLTE